MTESQDTPSLEDLTARALDEAISANCVEAAPVHFFLALLAQPSPQMRQVFSDHMVDPAALLNRMREEIGGGEVEVETPVLSASASELIASASDVDHVVAGLLKYLRNGDGSMLTKALNVAKVSPGRMAVMLEKLAPSTERIASVSPSSALSTSTASEPPKAARAWPKPKTLIEQLGRDWTEMAREGQLDPVIGRHDEIKQVVRVLLRKGKSCPVLVGEPGVGKTSVVAGLAHRIVADDAPPEIASMRIVEISPSSVLAGTRNRGDLEEKLEKIIKQAEEDPNMVLFLDEIHALVGATGNSQDAASVLKPALARGSLRAIGATTTDEYKKHIEKDGALERRFQPVRVEEPTEEEALKILEGLRPAYEAHHHVEITDAALSAAVSLSVRHLPDRRLPDKARDLIDQASVAQRFLSLSPRGKVADSGQPKVDKEDIASVVAEWSGIPAGRLTEDEKSRLLRMETELKKRVIGQDHAIAAIAKVIRTARAGLSKPSRPHGVFLFLGPTGVGKTETARALAEFLFDDENRLLRFDMSEYMEQHSVSKLIGSPPGYVGHEEGGRLTDAIRRTPYSVVLFDEIEKAHPRVADLFLQIFDDGRLTDAHGRQADFGHSTIIMTTNLGVGSTAPKRSVGFQKDNADEGDGPSQDALREALRQHFRPELLNRVSQVVMFKKLTPENVRAIIDKMLLGVQNRLAEQKITLEVSQPAYDLLLKLGFDESRGAREMDRVIERQIVHPLAEGVLQGDFASGSTVAIEADGDNVSLKAV